MAAGIETSAISVLKRAVEYDNQNRLTSAMVCYQEGIQLLMDYLKTINDDEQKRLALRDRIASYMSRAEAIKVLIQKQKDAGKFQEKIQITNGSTGHGYDRVIGHLLDSYVRNVEVLDPYIMAMHQCSNFLRFCELLVSRCSNLKSVTLTTKEDERGSVVDQKARLSQISDSLKSHGVNLVVHYSSTLHDREIRLDNGWIIGLGRGLDYFKPTPTKFSIGFFDLNLRECHETTITIGHKDFIRNA